MKVKKFKDVEKLNEMIETDDIDDVKGYLKRADPQNFTDEWMEDKSLARLLAAAVYHNFWEIENICRSNDGVLAPPVSDNIQGYLEQMFADTWDFMDTLRDFFYRVKQVRDRNIKKK